MLTVEKLLSALRHLPDDQEIRIGDVAERDNFHCSVGAVVDRNGSVIIVPGGDPVWKDETVSSVPNTRVVWPEGENNVQKT